MLFVGNVHYVDWLIFLFLHNTIFLKIKVYLQACKEDNGLKYDSNHMFTILFLFYISEIDIDTHKLLFTTAKVKDLPKQIEFMGIPFIIMGKKKFDCTHGVKRNRSLKKKILDENVKVERDTYMKRL